MNPDQPATGIDDYRAVLSIPGRDGQPRVIVGGQAVNLWAERYLAAEPELAGYLPFTSHDIDLLGELFDLQRLAHATGFKQQPAPRKVFVPSAGYLEMPHRSGKPVKVEILKRIFGPATEDVMKTALVLDRGSLRLRVIDPITLLAAKLENAVKLPQATRQDVKHLRMMVLCVRGFVREQLSAVAQGALSERDCVDILERVLQIASSRTAGQAAKRYGIQWLDVLPLKELNEFTHTRLRNFVQKRLKRWMDERP